MALREQAAAIIAVHELDNVLAATPPEGLTREELAAWYEGMIAYIDGMEQEVVLVTSRRETPWEPTNSF
jgi:hypothetical protein